METSLDGPAIALSLLTVGILLASGILWYLNVSPTKQPLATDAVSDPPENWQIGWVNFGLLICAAVISIAVVQLGLIALLGLSGDIPDLTVAPEEIKLSPTLALFSILSIQAPLFAVFYLFRRCMPEDFGGPLNSTRLNLFQSFRAGLIAFLRYVPIIWASAIIWSSFLQLLSRFGLVQSPPPQELITALQTSDDLVTIALICIGAVIIAPIVEEIFFRGAVYRFFKSKLSLYSAQLISGIIFSLIHQNLSVLVSLTIAGMCFAHAYERSGSLLVAMWFHSLFNLFALLSVLLIGLSEVSI